MKRFLTMCAGILLICQFTPPLTLAQNAGYEVKGVVVDKSGMPILGATVVEKGTTNGVSTGIDGDYAIRAAGPESVIEVSYVGYKTVSLVASSSLLAHLTLEEDAMGIDDVVVIGYGSVKKNDMTGSVVAIKAEEFNRGAVVSTQDMLKGKVPGVHIIPGDGGPGSSATIRVRGAASLNASNDPLIVIDGVPIAVDGGKGMANPLETINPNDIESFTVLKDASAAAIYGSRASNGVILVTTKKGRGNTPRVSYSGSVSVQTNSDELPVMSPGEFRTYIDQVYPAGTTTGDKVQSMLGDKNAVAVNTCVAYINTFMPSAEISIPAEVTGYVRASRNRPVPLALLICLVGIGLLLYDLFYLFFIRFNISLAYAYQILQIALLILKIAYCRRILVVIGLVCAFCTFGIRYKTVKLLLFTEQLCHLRIKLGLLALKILLVGFKQLLVRIQLLHICGKFVHELKILLAYLSNDLTAYHKVVEIGRACQYPEHIGRAGRVHCSDYLSKLFKVLLVLLVKLVNVGLGFCYSLVLLRYLVCERVYVALQSAYILIFVINKIVVVVNKLLLLVQQTGSFIEIFLLIGYIAFNTVYFITSLSVVLFYLLYSVLYIIDSKILRTCRSIRYDYTRCQCKYCDE